MEGKTREDARDIVKTWEDVIAELRANELFGFESRWHEDDVKFAVEIESKLSKWSRLPVDALSQRESIAITYLPILQEYLQ